MTAVTQMMNEFNKELEVAEAIGNEDKIRTIKHLINVASLYLPIEKQQIVDAFEKGQGAEAMQKFNKTGIKYYNETYKSE